MNRKHGLKVFILALLLSAVLLVPGLAVASQSATCESPGYDSPLDAAQAYLNALKDQDLKGMLSTFAIESYVDQMDLSKLVARMSTYSLNFDPVLPKGGPFARQLNIEQRRAKLSNSILIQFLHFNTPGNFRDDLRLRFMDAQEQEVFMDMMDKISSGSVLSSLVITGEAKPEELYKDFHSEGFQRHYADRAALLGINRHDLQDVVITFELVGQRWYFVAPTFRLNGRWYMESLSSQVAAAMGASLDAGGIMTLLSDWNLDVYSNP